jgi:hypothetical protein
MGEVAYDYSMVQDTGLQDMAATKAQELVRALRTAVSKGGFDNETVKDMVSKWTEVGMLAKGSGYWNSTRMVWALSHGPGNYAKKTSQELLDRMVRLENALSKHSDIKVRFDTFNAAQDAMLAFVAEYRIKLKGRGLSEMRDFDGQLKALLGSLDPNLWKQLGD